MSETQGLTINQLVVVEAMQWDGSRASIGECCEWVNRAWVNGELPEEEDEALLSYVYTGRDDVQAVLLWTGVDVEGVESGDWIIKSADGEFRPCKPDIFEKSYAKILGSVGVGSEHIGHFLGPIDIESAIRAKNERNKTASNWQGRPAG